jgi:hypothetical protein
VSESICEKLHLHPSDQKSKFRTWTVAEQLRGYRPGRDCLVCVHSGSNWNGLQALFWTAKWLPRATRSASGQTVTEGHIGSWGAAQRTVDQKPITVRSGSPSVHAVMVQAPVTYDALEPGTQYLLWLVASLYTWLEHASFLPDGSSISCLATDTSWHNLPQWFSGINCWQVSRLVSYDLYKSSNSRHIKQTTESKANEIITKLITSLWLGWPAREALIVGSKAALTSLEAVLWPLGFKKRNNYNFTGTYAVPLSGFFSSLLWPLGLKKKSL